MKEEKFNELIETLKNDFEGDNSYMSGVNDGMYHLKRKLQELNIFAVIGICFCGKPAIVYAFDTYFCQHHNDGLAKSFEARMKMPDNDFDGGGGA